MGLTKQDVLRLAKEHNVQFVNLQFTDIVGSLKAVTIPVWKLTVSGMSKAHACRSWVTFAVVISLRDEYRSPLKDPL